MLGGGGGGGRGRAFACGGGGYSRLVRPTQQPLGPLRLPAPHARPTSTRPLTSQTRGYYFFARHRLVGPSCFGDSASNDTPFIMSQDILAPRTILSRTLYMTSNISRLILPQQQQQQLCAPIITLDTHVLPARPGNYAPSHIVRQGILTRPHMPLKHTILQITKSFIWPMRLPIHCAHSLRTPPPCRRPRRKPRCAVYLSCGAS